MSAASFAERQRILLQQARWKSKKWLLLEDGLVRCSSMSRTSTHADADMGTNCHDDSLDGAPRRAAGTRTKAGGRSGTDWRWGQWQPPTIDDGE
ncbi:hypothetical protein DAI22_11g214700 [Oryza sativa Japonica Group]|nr:hypothetical protein DAI22_11g214700 [Oryza sativa Japonica Group]